MRRGTSGSGADITAPLVDAERGRISRIMLAVSAYGARTFGPALGEVFARLPSYARLDILVSESVLPEVSRWLGASGPGEAAYLITVPDDVAFSLWIQDLLLARTDRRLSVPPRSDRYQDLGAAKALVRGVDLTPEEVAYYFEGGNMIAAGDWLLVGADTLTQNGADTLGICAAIDPSRTPLVLGVNDTLAAEITRPTESPEAGWTETLHWRRSTESLQPVFHLDTFIAPAGVSGSGAPRFLVGCPRRGADLLEHPVWPHAISEAFDAVAAQLREHGAEVVRNPMPLVWKDDPKRRHRTWFHLPVNNVLVEDRGVQARTVWLPCFGGGHWSELDAVDNANAAIWALMGYSVIRVPGMMPMAENLGGLHCLAKVIERT